MKELGLVACTVYPKEGLYELPSVHRFRRIHNAASAYIGNKGALAYTYFSAHVLYHLFSALRTRPKLSHWVEYLERMYLVNVDLPDSRWRVLDVFDAITPFYASTHTPQEVTSWFSSAHCTNLVQMSWCKTSFVGVKEAHGS